MRRVFLLLVSLLFLPTVLSTNLYCEITSTCSYTTLLYLKNDTNGYMNAHAQDISTATYPWSICCNSTVSISNTCDDAVVLKLSSTTNAHVQIGNYSTGNVYNINACLSSDIGDVQCVYPNNNCPENYFCIASIASSYNNDNNETNAHIGPCDEYTRKVCCYVKGVISECMNITESGYYNITNDISAKGTCINITVSDVVIDCNFHKILYSENENGYGIFIGNEIENITIKNCQFINGNSSVESYGIYSYYTKVDDLEIYNNVFNLTVDYDGRYSKGVKLYDLNVSFYNNTFYYNWTSSTAYYDYRMLEIMGDSNMEVYPQYFSKVYNNEFYFYNNGAGRSVLVLVGTTSFYNNYFEDVLLDRKSVV